VTARGGRLWTVLGPFLGLLLVVTLFALLEPEAFLSAYNLKTVVNQAVIVALAGIGMTFVIISGGIDLSVGSVMALASVVTAIVLRDAGSPILALLAGIAAGTVVGFANGLLITALRVVPFIVTLGTLSIARGGARQLADNAPVNVDAGWLLGLMSKTPQPGWLQVSVGVWLTVLLAVAMMAVLHRSRLGVHAFAIGSSEATARLCGVNVARAKITVYGLGGAFAGLAGALLFCRIGQGDPTEARGKELDVIAAVVIGGGSLAGGEGSILGTLIGALIMAFLSNGCTLAGVPDHWQLVLTGAIIIAAVVVDRLRHRE
jgi:ribose transport system permease protein